MRSNTNFNSYDEVEVQKRKFLIDASSGEPFYHIKRGQKDEFNAIMNYEVNIHDTF